MTLPHSERQAYMLRGELPPAGYGIGGENSNGPHWTESKKAIVVKALRQGALSLAEAQERYALSTEELLTWFETYKAE